MAAHFRVRWRKTRRLQSTIHAEFPVLPGTPHNVEPRLHPAIRTTALPSRKLQRAIPAPWAGLPVAPAAVPFPSYLRGAALKRRSTAFDSLTVEQADYPPTPAALTAQGFPAWQTRPIPTRSTRYTLRTPFLVEYPETPAPVIFPYPSWVPPKQFEFDFRRTRRELLELNEYPATPIPPSTTAEPVEEAFITRKLSGRKLQPGVKIPWASGPAGPALTAEGFPAWRSQPALQARPTRRVHDARGGAGVDGQLAPEAPELFPSWLAQTQPRTRPTARRLQPGSAIPWAEPAPPPTTAEGFPAWRRQPSLRALPTHRVHDPVGIGVDGQLPPEPELPAWQAKLALARRPTSYDLQTVQPTDTYPQTPVPLSGAEHIRIDALRRRETRRTRRQAAHNPAYPPTPAPFQPDAAWGLKLANQVVHRVTLRTFIYPPVYPASPAPPSAVQFACRTHIGPAIMPGFD